MSAISMLNPKAEVARASQALAINIGAAKGIQEVLKTNLGPKGTMKMLVSGAGDIKITKDGNVLLHEMVRQHKFIQFLMLLCPASVVVSACSLCSTRVDIVVCKICQSNEGDC